VRGNTWDCAYSLWDSYGVVGVVHHSANADSLAKEMPSGLRMSDEQVDYVALFAEIVVVCTLDRGIMNGTCRCKVNLRFINAVCCR
jgi:hypothetical protein